MCVCVCVCVSTATFSTAKYQNVQLREQAKVPVRYSGGSGWRQTQLVKLVMPSVSLSSSRPSSKSIDDDLVGVLRAPSEWRVTDSATRTVHQPAI